jgi:hypothetical protein
MDFPLRIRAQPAIRAFKHLCRIRIAFQLPFQPRDAYNAKLTPILFAKRPGMGIVREVGARPKERRSFVQVNVGERGKRGSSLPEVCALFSIPVSSKKEPQFRNIFRSKASAIA